MQTSFLNKMTHMMCSIVLLFCLFMYERNLMFADVNAGPQVAQFMVIIMVVSFLLFARNLSFICDGVGRFLALLLIPVYALSLMHGLFDPLGSMLQHFTIIVPLFLFVSGSQIIYNQESPSSFFWCACIVFYSLAIYYFFNYSTNAFYDITRQTSSSYCVLYMLPFVLCVKNRTVHYISFILMFVVLMFSLKRGGFIAYCFGLFLYVMPIFLKKLDLKKILVFVPLFIVLVYFAVFLFDYVDSLLGGAMSMRFANDQTGSGREFIYSDAISMMQNSSIFDLFFGHGWNSFEKFYWMHMPAHNDFLEIVFDHGVVCALLYLFFCGSLVMYGVKMIKCQSFYAPAMCCSLGIFFVNSVVSHVFIYERYMMLFCLFWGAVSVSFERENIKKLSKVNHGCKNV